MAFLARLDKHWFPDSENEVRWSQDRRAHIRIPARVGRALVKSVLAILKIVRNWCRFTYTAFLAPCIPLAIALGASDHYAKATFATAYLGLLATSGLYRHGSELLLLSSAVPDEIRLAWSFTFEVFSVDVEVAIMALCYSRLALLRGYIVGKIVQTLLLSLGASFIAAGLRRGESHYNETASATLCGLLLAATTAIGLAAGMSSISTVPVPSVSRGAALVLIGIYVIYVYFRRRTHARLFEAEAQDQWETGSGVSIQGPSDHYSANYDWITAILLMCTAIVLAFFCGRYMLLAAEESNAMHETFLGYFMMPLISNLVDIPKSWSLGYKDKMDIALEIAAGTSIQTALCIGPALIILGWIRQEQFAYSLNTFEYSSLFASVWVFSFLVSQGKSNYLSGMQCIGLYLIQVLAMYLYTRS